MTPRIARKIKVDAYLNSAKQPRFNVTVGNKTHILDISEIRQLMSDIRSELEYLDDCRSDNDRPTEEN
jgi:hypothetical protein